MAKLKAILLILAGFIGAFTVMAFSIPPRTSADVLIPIAILLPIYVAHVALLARMWGHPPGRRYFGHSRRTWTFLLLVAYLAGIVSSLLS